MSNEKAAKNRDLVEDHNMDEVIHIMGNCVTVLSRI